MPSVETDCTWTEDSKNPGHLFRYIRDYTPPGVVRRIGGGNSCVVGLLEDGTVLKYPLVKGEGMEILTIEKAIYDALGDHKRIVPCLGITDYGLNLGYARQGSVADHLSKRPGPSSRTRTKWCLQTAEALDFIHSRGVIHCDLHPNNLLLDAELDVLLSDFQGVFGNLDGYAMESPRYFLPREAACAPNEITDIFALGTLMYTIMIGAEPFAQLEESEVTNRYSMGEFPDTTAIAWGSIIQQCWKQQYNSAADIVYDLGTHWHRTGMACDGLDPLSALDDPAAKRMREESEAVAPRNG